MRDATADSTKKTDSKKRTHHHTLSNDHTALDRCYGQIGISAVAAAVRYQGSAKNPAYAPTPTQWRDRLAEAAA